MTAHVIGWTLVHSLWEGGLIAALLLIVRGFMGGARSDTRYLVSVAALALMLVAPVCTAILLSGHGGSVPSSLVPIVGAQTFAIAARQHVDLATPWLVDLWVIGVVAFSIRLGAGLVRTRALITEDTRPAEEWVAQLAGRLMDRLGMKQVIRVLESSRVRVPLVAGWLRPVLLIPGSLLTGLTPHQLELIIVHELAHIRRHDYIVNVCQAVAETLLFYHPATWWISGSIREEREHCCDDFILVACGDCAREYATVLLTIEESRGRSLGFAAAASGGSLVRRVRRLVSGRAALDESRVKAFLTSVGVALAALLIGLLSTTRAPGATRLAIALEARDQLSSAALVLAPNPVGVFHPLDIETHPVSRTPARAASVRASAIQSGSGLALNTRVLRAISSGPSSDRRPVWIDYTIRGATSNVTNVYLNLVADGEDEPRLVGVRESAPPAGNGDLEGESITAIGSVGAAESVALLERFVPDAPDSVGEEVAALIGRHRDAPALSALADIARTESAVTVKAAAVVAIGLLPLSGAVDTLGAMAGDLDSHDLRRVAVDALSESPAASSAVRQLRLLALGRYPVDVRRNAVAELSSFPPPLAVSALSDILDDGDRNVQRTALESLGKLAPSPDALAVLESTKGVWASENRPDIQVRAMRQLRDHPFDVDSAFLQQVENQHPNQQVVGIAHAMRGGE